MYNIIDYGPLYLLSYDNLNLIVKNLLLFKVTETKNLKA